MTQQESQVYVAAIIDTMADSGGEAPEGIMYAVLMSRISLDEFYVLMGALERLNWISRSNHVAKLTAEGFAISAKLKAAVATA